MRALTLCLALFLANAAPAAAQNFNAQERAEIRAVVRDYLVENPDVLREALDALEQRVSEERWQAIKSDSRDFSLGPANAPITIVEFFDYRCPYCHAALEWVRDIAGARDDVRFVFKELPILSAESMEASRAAVAAIPQGRYWAFHQALMADRGQLTSARIDAIARENGIDVPRMRRAMDSEDITELLQQNHGQAADYGITGTPGFIINGELVSGFNRQALEARLREVTRNTRTRQARN